MYVERLVEDVGDSLIESLSAQAAAVATLPENLRTPLDAPAPSTSLVRTFSAAWASNPTVANGKMTGRRYKRLGDLKLLCGNVHEASAAYDKAIELLMRSGSPEERVWYAAALEGSASAYTVLAEVHAASHTEMSHEKRSEYAEWMLAARKRLEESITVHAYKADLPVELQVPTRRTHARTHARTCTRALAHVHRQGSASA